MTVIAYLAPEIPARSATFVYREAEAMMRAGCRVLYFAVRAPDDPAPGMAQLTAQVRILYARSRTGRLAAALDAVGLVLRHSLARGRRRTIGLALRALCEDLGSLPGGLLARLKLLHQWLAAARLADALRRQGADHLHVHFSHVPGTIGMYASLLSGVPYTIVAHANDVHVQGSLLRQKAQRSKAMVAISRAMRDELQRRGVAAERIRVIRCAPAPAFGAHAEGAGAAAAAPTRWVVGGLGRLVAKKGFADLLAAAAELRAAGVNLELRIAGNGPEGERLRARAAALGLQAQVRFDGALAPAEVPAWMAALDCFVLPCTLAGDGDMDGIPVVLMEAMASGVPVVSTALSGIPELVIEGQTGLLARPGDTHAIAGAMRRLHDDVALRKALVAGALKHLQQEFDPDLNASRLLAVITAP
ncbi:MAG: glycosyltransferase [Pseudomonadota bacterium]|nr:glycosyltransferase [Pseudomonadota bacterium]